MEELDFASVSQQSLVQVSERREEDETSAVSPTLPSNAAEAQRSRQVRHSQSTVCFLK